MDERFINRQQFGIVNLKLRISNANEVDSMNVKSVFRILLVLMLMISGAYMVSAVVEAAIPVVTILTPPDGANLTISNGTTTSIVVIVNVSANSTTNITNVTVFLMNAANGTIATIGSNASINASDGNQTFNFTIVNANISGQSDGIRNYSINAYATTAVSNGTLVNAIANISKVNISIDNTAPTVAQNSPANATNQTGLSVTFSFTATDNNYTLEIEEWYNLTCTVYSGSDNRTTINNTYRSGNASTVTNTSMAQKLHKWKVQCVDAFGIGANSSIRDLTIDAAAPANANTTVSVSTLNYGKSLTLTCAGSDAISNTSNATLAVKNPELSSFERVVNSTTNNVSTSFTSTRTLGIFEVNCSVIDYTGNQNSSVATFEVIRAPSGQEYIPPKGGQPIAKKIIGSGKTVDIGELETTDARLMAETAKLIFSVNGEEHSIYVAELTAESVTLLVTSEPQELTLKIGETVELDLDEDGVNDVSINLNGIFRGKADIAVINLHNVPAPAGEEPSQEPPTVIVDQPQPSKTRSTIFTILIIIAVILVLGYLYTKFRQRKQRIRFSPKDLGSNRPASSGSYPSYPRQPPSSPSQPVQRTQPAKEVVSYDKPLRSASSFQQPQRYANMPYTNVGFVNRRYPER